MSILDQQGHYCMDVTIYPCLNLLTWQETVVCGDTLLTASFCPVCELFFAFVAHHLVGDIPV